MGFAEAAADGLTFDTQGRLNNLSGEHGYDGGP
jgi:hypothetical protein